MRFPSVCCNKIFLGMLKTTKFSWRKVEVLFCTLFQGRNFKKQNKASNQLINLRTV